MIVHQMNQKKTIGIAHVDVLFVNKYFVMLDVIDHQSFVVEQTDTNQVFIYHVYTFFS